MQKFLKLYGINFETGINSETDRLGSKISQSNYMDENAICLGHHIYGGASWEKIAQQQGPVQFQNKITRFLCTGFVL